MSVHRLAAVSAAAAVAVLATSGVASAARTPVVSKERTLTTRTAPVAIAGIRRGARLPRGDRLVFRTVTLANGQRVQLTLNAPRGMTLRRVVSGDRAAIRFTVVRPSRYVGRRSVVLRAFVARGARAGTHSGRIWALVR